MSSIEKSQTDTEVLVNVISYNYSSLKAINKKDRVIKSIEKSDWFEVVLMVMPFLLFHKISLCDAAQW